MVFDNQIVIEQFDFTEPEKPRYLFSLPGILSYDIPYLAIFFVFVIAAIVIGLTVS